MNTWIECRTIKWEASEKGLPSYLEAIAITDLKDKSRRGIVKAITRYLREKYGVKGSCEDFKIYSEKEGNRYDFLLMLGCMFK